MEAVVYLTGGGAWQWARYNADGTIDERSERFVTKEEAITAARETHDTVTDLTDWANAVVEGGTDT